MARCQCGCGQEIAFKPHHKYRPPRFIAGHHQTVDTIRNARRHKIIIQPPPDDVPSGFCECGCGQRTPIARQSRPKDRVYYGYALRFIHGHNPRGKRAFGWKGGRKQDKLGYRFVFKPEHPAAYKSGYIPEHRLVWQERTGESLSPDQHVHHIDFEPSNNEPDNLQALSCGDHVALHAADNRTRQRRSAANRRRYRDPEERRKTSDAMKRVWAARKSTDQR